MGSVEDVMVTDNCTNVTVSVADVTIAGDCPQESTIERTYTAVDNCGNTATHTQIINIVDTTAPEFEFVAEDATVECSDELPAAASLAFDNCGEVTVAVTEATIDGNCPAEYTLVRTYVATDECGNSSEPVTQTITVVDTTAPEFTFVAADATVECSDDLPASGAEATDNCGSVTIGMSEAITEGECAAEYTLVRT
jgi:hypothetical protein